LLYRPDSLRKLPKFFGELEIHWHGDIVPIDGEDDMPDCEPGIEGHTIAPSRVVPIDPRMGNHQSLSFPVYVGGRARQKDAVSTWGLLYRMEAAMFRIWYDVLGWVKMLHHERGLHRPRRK